MATPHPLHYENTLQALQAGKPVLVEKAFTMNAAEARELVAAARAARLFLMEAMWTRFLPHIAEIRRLINDGVLGEIVTVMADHGKAFDRAATSRISLPSSEAARSSIWASTMSPSPRWCSAHQRKSPR